MGTVEERLGLAEVTDLLERARDMHAVTGAVVSEIYDRGKKMRKSAIASITDEELWADDELRRWFMTAEAGMTVYRRREAFLNQLLKGTKVREGLAGGDGREGFYGLPVVGLGLNYRQDVEAEEKAIRAWTEKFAFGRDAEMLFSILSYDLSQHGSPRLEWDSLLDKAQVILRVYGHDSVEHEGSLRTALEYVAERFWYEGGPRGEFDEDYDD